MHPNNKKTLFTIQHINAKMLTLSSLVATSYLRIFLIVSFSLTILVTPAILYAKNLEGFTYEEEQKIMKASENLKNALDERDRIEKKIHEPKVQESDGSGLYVVLSIAAVGICIHALKKKREAKRENELKLAARERFRKIEEEEQARKRKLLYIVNKAIDSGLNIDSCTKKCDDCAELIKLMAKRCRFCGCRYTKDEILKSAYDISESYLSKNRRDNTSKFMGNK